jgi:hypothetical protein
MLINEPTSDESIEDGWMDGYLQSGQPQESSRKPGFCKTLQTLL